MKNFMERAILMFQSSNTQDRFCGIDLDWLGSGQGRIALDFGCGNGRISVELLRRGYVVVAFDIVSHEEERIRKQLSKIENDSFVFCHNDNDKLIKYKNQIDLIICRETLEHVPDCENLMFLFKNLLKCSGIAVVSVPTEMTERIFLTLDSKWLLKSEHTKIFKDKYLRHIFEISGFQIVQMKTDGFKWFIFWLLLSPFKIEHKMGNPSNNSFWIRFAFKIVHFVERCTVLENIGNVIFPKSKYYYLAHHKRTILCVYDYEDWILGTWAKNIMSIYQEKFNFFLLSMDDCAKNKRLVKKLVAKVDAVFLLLPHPFVFFKQLNPAILICAIHHWVDYSHFYSNPIMNSDFIVTGANQWRENILEKNSSAKVCVVHSGYDDRFAVSDYPRFFKKDKIVLGFFGKYSSNESDRKGVRHLMSLIEYLSVAKIVSNYSIIITGDGWESVVAKICEFGMEVLYYGRVDSGEMPSIYNKIDFYLMLSDIEGGPATISESFASGCVTISTPVGISLDIIQDKINGFIVDASNKIKLAELLEFLRLNPLLCSAISENAKLFARKYLSYKETFKPLDKFLDQAVSNNVSGAEYLLAYNLYQKIHNNRVKR